MKEAICPSHHLPASDAAPHIVWQVAEPRPSTVCSIHHVLVKGCVQHEPAAVGLQTLRHQLLRKGGLAGASACGDTAAVSNTDIRL
jgi:hypothetical protein